MEHLPNLGQGEVVDGEPPSPDPTEFDLLKKSLDMDIENIENDIALQHVLDPEFEAFHAVLEAFPVVAPVTNIHVEVYLYINLNIAGSTTTPAESHAGKSKGKEKVLSEYSFNDKGLLTKEAIKILDEGILISFSEAFKGPVIDLEAEIYHGIFAKDLLEGAVTGNLKQILEKVRTPKHTTGKSAIKMAEQIAPKQVSIPLDSVIPVDLMDVEEVLLEMARFDEQQRANQEPAMES